MFYAGIGSRSAPRDVLNTMHKIACELRELGYILRSGGAPGADTAFEDGAGRDAEIFIPWPGFGNRRHGIVCGDVSWMRELAKDFHPAWESCSRGAKALHTRNVAQVLGQQESPASAFVVCWTPEGKGGGGTGQALRIAHFCGIPAYDLGAADGLERFRGEVLRV